MERVKSSWSHRIQTNIKSRILAGILVVIPLGVTVFILNVLFNLIYNIVLPVFPLFADYVPQQYFTIISIILLFCVLYIIGLLTRFFLGKKLIALFEHIFLNIPVVSSIYSASKKVVTTLSFSSKAEFQSVVLVDFPVPGKKMLGFVTGAINDSHGHSYLNVFIPTTPNPTSGFLQLIPAKEVQRLNIKIDDAIQMIISGGIISPEILDLKKS